MPVQIADILDRNAILVNPSPGDKYDLLKEMIDRLAADRKLKAPRKALADLMEREKEKGTGLEHGVAVPHCRTSGSEQLTAAFALVPRGIDFGALDGNLSRFIFLLISPSDATTAHVQALATMARLLKQESVQNDLLHATEPDEVVRILLEAKT